MPGDAFRKKFRGQPWRTDARVQNALMDAAADAKAARGPGFEATPAEHFRQGDVVPVLNDTTQAVPRFGVLGISTPIVLPAKNLGEFQQRVALRGVVPTSAHAGKFAVLIEPVPAGAVGRGIVSGATPGKVKAGSGDRADVIAGDVTQLAQQSSGAAQILWVDPGVSAGSTADALLCMRGVGASGGAVDVTSFYDQGRRTDDYYAAGFVSPVIASGGIGPPGGVLLAMPFWSDRGGTIDQLAVVGYSGNQSGGNLRLGVYSGRADGPFPDRLLFADSTTLGSFWGVYKKSCSVTLTPGAPYWYVYATDAGSGVVIAATSAGNACWGVSTILGFTAAVNSTVYRVAVAQTYGGGALPDPFPGTLATTAFLSSNGGVPGGLRGGGYPLLFYRFAA